MMMMMDRRAGAAGAGHNAGGTGVVSGGGSWHGANRDPSMAWKMGRIMLGFRPIAPKPPVPGSVPVNPIVSCETKSKRKRGAGSGRGRGKKRKIEPVAQAPPPPSSGSGSVDSSSTSIESTTSTIVTLPLLPETPEAKDESPRMNQSLPWFQTMEVVAPVPSVKQTVMSWVTVERVTEAWKESEVVGGFRSDAAVVRALEADSAPAFVSDEWGRVCWTNEAYRKMVLGSEREGYEVNVGLVARSAFPGGGSLRAFTCMVRVRYECRRKGTVTMAAPCDVWRMDGGGWAWRLDLKAALSLSL